MAPVGATIRYMAYHTSLLHQFMRQVLAKVQTFIHLSPSANSLSRAQFVVVLQASRETARLMELGATAEDIANMRISLLSREGLP